MLVLFEVVQCSRNATAQLSKIIYSLVVIDDIDAAIERERERERERESTRDDRVVYVFESRRFFVVTTHNALAPVHLLRESLSLELAK